MKVMDSIFVVFHLPTASVLLLKRAYDDSMEHAYGHADLDRIVEAPVLGPRCFDQVGTRALSELVQPKL